MTHIISPSRFFFLSVRGTVCWEKKGIRRRRKEEEKVVAGFDHLVEGLLLHPLLSYFLSPFLFSSSPPLGGLLVPKKEEESSGTTSSSSSSSSVHSPLSLALPTLSSHGLPVFTLDIRLVSVEGRA